MSELRLPIHTTPQCLLANCLPPYSPPFPHHQIVPFFNSMGFVIPERKAVADFLLVGGGGLGGRGGAGGEGREAGAKAFRSSVMCGTFGTVWGLLRLSIFEP